MERKYLNKKLVNGKWFKIILIVFFSFSLLIQSIKTFQDNVLFGALYLILGLGLLYIVKVIAKKKAELYSFDSKYFFIESKNDTHQKFPLKNIKELNRPTFQPGNGNTNYRKIIIQFEGKEITLKMHATPYKNFELLKKLVPKMNPKAQMTGFW